MTVTDKMTSRRVLKHNGESAHPNQAGKRIVPVDDGTSIATTGPSSPGPSAASPGPSAASIGKEKKNYRVGKLDIYFLGIGIVIGGQYFSWNSGLNAGLYTCLIVYLIMGLAYICFILCTAEINGALPFAGGSYGIARCTLGFFPAFVIGITETMEYITTVACATMTVSDLLVSIFPLLSPYEPLLSAIIIILSTALQIAGKGPFWITSLFMGAISLGILLVYSFGCLGYVNFKTNALADSSQLFIGGIKQFMVILPFSSMSFIGIEILNLVSDDVENPKSKIPVAQVSCVCTLFITGLFVFFVTVSLPIEGGLAAIAALFSPFGNGLKLMFNASPAMVSALTIPPQLASVTGFGWAATKLMTAMAESKLLPKWFATTSTRYQTPHNAIIIGGIIGYIICVLVHFYTQIQMYLFLIMFLFAFMSYTGQCIAYITLKVHYPLLKKSEFKNPLGLAGAIYSLCVWIISIIAVCGFQGHNGIELGIVVAIIIVTGIYYWIYARKHQTMSSKESKIFLVAHISKFNARKAVKYNPNPPSNQNSNGSSRTDHEVHSNR